VSGHQGGLRYLDSEEKGSSVAGQIVVAKRDRTRDVEERMTSQAD
jgi:hypothetical protein